MTIRNMNQIELGKDWINIRSISQIEAIKVRKKDNITTAWIRKE